MAAIVRVKRRIDEDPAESLLLKFKRLKSSQESQPENESPSDEIKNLFKFAATVTTKDVTVTNHVRDAIRREKLQREYKQHQVDITHRKRQTKKAATTNHRFKIVSSHRANNLPSLDESDAASTTVQSKNSSSAKSSGDGARNETASAAAATAETTVSMVTQNASGDDGGAGDQKSVCESETVSDEAAQALYCLYDVECDFEQTSTNKSTPSSTEVFTCNNVPMIREKITRAEQYVYDIYYMNNTRGLDWRGLEDVLTIEAYRDDYVSTAGPRNAAEDQAMYGEDEDSNDEDNWRNDYPDHDDPLVFGDDGEGMHGYGAEEDDEDDGQDDYLAYYGMSDMLDKRLRILDEDELSSDDGDFAYFGQPLKTSTTWTAQSDYETYKKRVLRELDESASSDDDYMS